MPKQQLQEMVRGYLGSEVSQPLALAKYVPGLPFRNHIAGLTWPNTTYNILEQALTDPIYAFVTINHRLFIVSLIISYFYITF